MLQDGTLGRALGAACPPANLRAIASVSVSCYFYHMAAHAGPPLFRIRCVLTASAPHATMVRDFSILDAEETEKAARFFAADDRRDYIAAHALLRRTLTVASPATSPERWKFERTEHGKPYLRAAVTNNNSSLRFSLSHTRGL